MGETNPRCLWQLVNSSLVVSVCNVQNGCHNKVCEPRKAAQNLAPVQRLVPGRVTRADLRGRTEIQPHSNRQGSTFAAACFATSGGFYTVVAWDEVGWGELS